MYKIEILLKKNEKEKTLLSEGFEPGTFTSRVEYATNLTTRKSQNKLYFSLEI